MEFNQMETITITNKQLNTILTALTLYSDSIPTRKKQLIKDYTLTLISQEQLTGNTAFLDRVREQIEELKDSIIEQTN